MQLHFGHKKTFITEKPAETECYDNGGKNCGPALTCLGHTGQLSS